MSSSEARVSDPAGQDRCARLMAQRVDLRAYQDSIATLPDDITDITEQTNRPAGLIEEIATDAHAQGGIVRQIATAMEGVLQIAAETSAGMRQPAGPVGKPAAPAENLAGSGRLQGLMQPQ